MTLAKFTIIGIGTLSRNKFWGETERARSGVATCTLLDAGGKRLIVDPSPAPDLMEPMLFARSGLRPAAIELVFLTHFHGDHRYGLDLFAGKPWLMAAKGIEEWKQRAPKDAELANQFVAAEERLPEGVSLFPSPGHLDGHCSLLCQTKWGRLIVAGDAVMTEEFFDAGEGFQNSVDFSRAARTIEDIKKAADLIVPGHGNYFLNKALP